MFSLALYSISKLAPIKHNNLQKTSFIPYLCIVKLWFTMKINEKVFSNFTKFDFPGKISFETHVLSSSYAFAKDFRFFIYESQSNVNQNYNPTGIVNVIAGHVL